LGDSGAGRQAEQFLRRPASGAAKPQPGAGDTLDTATVDALASFHPFALRMQHIRAAGQAAADFAQRRLRFREAVAIRWPRKAAMTGDDRATGDAGETVEPFPDEARDDIEPTAGAAKNVRAGQGAGFRHW